LEAGGGSRQRRAARGGTRLTLVRRCGFTPVESRVESA